MPSSSTQLAPSFEDADVRDAALSEALVEVCRRLDLSQRLCAEITGLSKSEVHRVFHGKRVVDHASKEGELALLLVRSYRSLDAILPDDDAKRAWLGADNDHLGAPPADLLVTARGLVHVVEYLDAFRGKL